MAPVRAAPGPAGSAGETRHPQPGKPRLKAVQRLLARKAPYHGRPATGIRRAPGASAAAFRMLIGGAVGYTVGWVGAVSGGVFVTPPEATRRAVSPIEKCQRAGRWEMFPCHSGVMAGADL
jgi:hypothetical protein